jgi:hypothetical protein
MFIALLLFVDCVTKRDMKLTSIYGILEAWDLPDDWDKKKLTNIHGILETSDLFDDQDMKLTSIHRILKVLVWLTTRSFFD